MPQNTSYRARGESASPSFVAEYKSAYNAITQPNKIVFCSQYFVDRWMPLLGGVGTQIVLALRRKCWHDRETGQHREEVKMSLAELARRVGCSVATVKRELANNEVLSCFVQRERTYRDGEGGRVVRDENIYHVFMDDPAHVDDKARLEAEQERREKGEARKVQSAPYKYAKAVSKAQIELYAAQDEPAPVQNGRAKAQNEPQTVQNEPTLSDTPDTSDTQQHTSDTPRERAGARPVTAPGECVVVSSQRRGEPAEPGAGYQAFKAKQAALREQTRRKLMGIGGGQEAAKGEGAGE